MIDYKWYQDVFSRNMLQQDCHKPCWKERLIDGLPPIFAHKVKHVLISANDSLNYGNLTNDNTFNNIKNYYSLLLFTCHYSQYYSALLFTPNYCLFKGGCPLFSKQVFFQISSLERDFP